MNATEMNFATQQQVLKQCYQVINRAYDRGVEDGRSAYENYDFYGDKDLANNYEKLFRRVFSKNHIRFAKYVKDPFIEDVMVICEHYYQIGTEDGMQSKTHYDFAKDFFNQVETKLNQLFKQYHLI